MFDVSYKRLRNKGRCGRRGPKKRYSVFRAELNLEREEDYERWCRNFCEKKGVDLDSIKIEDARFPWMLTWEHIKIIRRTWPYSFHPRVMRIFSEEQIEALKRNIEIADQMRKERLPMRD